MKDRLRLGLTAVAFAGIAALSTGCADKSNAQPATPELVDAISGDGYEITRAKLTTDTSRRGPSNIIYIRSFRTEKGSEVAHLRNALDRVGETCTLRDAQQPFAINGEIFKELRVDFANCLPLR